MRPTSPAVSKGYRAATYNLVPREGTRVRATFDLFMANKGIPIQLPGTSHNENTRINYLMDFYGLDIRRVGKRRWVLMGEWFGQTYVDYVAPQVRDHKGA